MATKRIVQLASILAVLILIGFTLFFHRIDLKLYHQPIQFERVVLENDSLLGVWKADFGYFHDCNGCETKNVKYLFIGKDSTAAINEEIYQLDYLFRIPIINQYYGIPNSSLIIELYEYEIRGNCLIEFTNDQNSAMELDSFAEVFPNCSEFVSENEHPIYAHKMMWDGDSVILTD